MGSSDPITSALAVAREARRRVLARAKALPRSRRRELVAVARRELARVEPLLARTVRDGQILAWLEGGRDQVRTLALPAVAEAQTPGVRPAAVTTADRTPAEDDAPGETTTAVRQAGSSGGSRTPPPTLYFPDRPDDPEPPVRFPQVERAARYLATRLDYTPEEFAELDDDARRVGFTVAKAATLAAVEHVRKALAEDVATGGTAKAFRARVREVLDESAVSDAQVEGLYRTNVARAYSAGQQDVLNHPLVAGETPFLEWSATHDGRVRPEHLAFEHMGLDGTAVYRADDPIWDQWYPPIGWNCVPGETAVLTGRGRVRIDQVRKGDVVLTHRGRWRAVVGVHRSEGPAELVGADLEEGGVVRATGNHRVLTQRGWVEAAALNIKDHLYQVVDSVQADVVGREVEHRPRTSSPDLGIPITRRDATGLLHLDPNGQIGQPEIHPEGRERAVKLIGESGILQRRSRDRFVLRHLGSEVHVLRGIDEVGRPPGGVGRRPNLGVSEHPFRHGRRGGASFGVPGVLTSRGFRHGADLGAGLREDPPQCSESHSSFLSDISQRYLASGVVGKHRFGSAGPRRVDATDGPPQVGGRTIGLNSHLVAFRGVRISNLRSIMWGRQPVFNLSVDEDESYVAGGVVMHNCRCLVIPLTVDDAAARGVKEAIRWRDTGEPPARPQFVKPPPFSLPKGWAPVGRRLSAVL